MEALLENRDGVLKPGFFARASIVSSRVDEALIVPQDALRYLYGVYKVYTVEKSALHETEVKLGRAGRRHGRDRLRPQGRRARGGARSKAKSCATAPRWKRSSDASSAAWQADQ